MRFSFFHKLVVPSPLIHTLKYFHHLLRFHWVIGLKKICVYKIRKFLNLHDQYTDIFESPCIETGRFNIFCVLYTEILESPCIETRRFKTFHVLYTYIFLRPITQWNRNRWGKYFMVWIRGLGLKEFENLMLLSL